MKAAEAAEAADMAAFFIFRALCVGFCKGYVRKRQDKRSLCSEKQICSFADYFVARQ
ncbi:hypothetical protein [Burkholderia guangdongensis]|uniref:hypothetical protein n=1 Tax=Burkholderia guangdongensis TaxID=1792500 RepID=UPI0015CE5BC1|nr:hypothetical protein [Burkholderia guangdongensis]